MNPHVLPEPCFTTEVAIPGVWGNIEGLSPHLRARWVILEGYHIRHVVCPDFELGEREGYREMVEEEKKGRREEQKKVEFRSRWQGSLAALPGNW